MIRAKLDEMIVPDNIKRKNYLTPKAKRLIKKTEIYLQQRSKPTSQICKVVKNYQGHLNLWKISAKFFRLGLFRKRTCVYVKYDREGSCETF